MSNHYFSNNPYLKYAPRSKITFDFKGINFTFWASAGVFSAKDIDTGTRIFLQYLKIPQTGKFLDLGAGYGVIGVIILRLAGSNELDGTFIEVNPIAGKLIKKNLLENGCSKATIVIDDFMEHNFVGSFDYIVCNPPLKRGLAYVEKMFEKVARLLKAGGTFQFVAKTRLGAKRLRDYLSSPNLGFTDISEEIDGGYRVVTCNRL